MHSTLRRINIVLCSVAECAECICVILILIDCVIKGYFRHVKYCKYVYNQLCLFVIEINN